MPQKKLEPTDKKKLRRSKLVKIIIDAIEDKKGERITIIKMNKENRSLTDYYIIAEAQTHIQIKSIADHIRQEVKEKNKMPRVITEENKSYKWIVVDLGEVIVHILDPENRAFYDIESLWSDNETENLW